MTSIQSREWRVRAHLNTKKANIAVCLQPSCSFCEDNVKNISAVIPRGMNTVKNDTVPARLNAPLTVRVLDSQLTFNYCLISNVVVFAFNYYSHLLCFSSSPLAPSEE
jgi:hypothetical protein